MAGDSGARVRHGAPRTTGPFVAIGATLNRAQDQWHTGLVYRTQAGEAPRFLHLADDKKLLDQPLDHERLGWEHGYIWLKVPVPLEKARAIAQLCRRIAERVKTDGQTVRYSIRHHLGRFDLTGAYVPHQEERGLTCATCVMAVCRGAEVELVDVASWPVRNEDRAWIGRIVARLHLIGDADYAGAVEADGLVARFRPPEVAGACLLPPLRVPFQQAVYTAAVVVRRYDELLPAAVD